MVVPGHNLGNSQVSVNRTIGPTLVFICVELNLFALMLVYVTQCTMGDSGLPRSGKKAGK